MRVYKYLVLCLLCICFCTSCKDNSQSRLFAKYLKDTYLIDIGNKDAVFIIYSDPACASCNGKIREFLNTSEAVPNLYIIYAAHYPDMELHDLWKEKYKERLLIDRTDYIKGLMPDLIGSGKVVVKNGKISDVKAFNPVEMSFEDFIKQ